MHEWYVTFVACDTKTTWCTFYGILYQVKQELYIVLMKQNTKHDSSSD